MHYLLLPIFLLMFLLPHFRKKNHKFLLNCCYVFFVISLISFYIKHACITRSGFLFFIFYFVFFSFLFFSAHSWQPDSNREPLVSERGNVSFYQRCYCYIRFFLSYVCIFNDPHGKKWTFCFASAKKILCQYFLITDEFAIIHVIISCQQNFVFNLP